MIKFVTTCDNRSSAERSFGGHEPIIPFTMSALHPRSNKGRPIQPVKFGRIGSGALAAGAISHRQKLCDMGGSGL
eukprot:1872091-Rhodomonas_salina.2